MKLALQMNFMKLRLQEAGSLFMLGGCLSYHLGRCLHQGHKLRRAIPQALNWQKLPCALRQPPCSSINISILPFLEISNFNQFVISALNATNAYNFSKRRIKKVFIALRLHNIISCIAMQNIDKDLLRDCESMGGYGSLNVQPFLAIDAVRVK